MARAFQKVSDQEILAYLDDQNSILAEPVPNTSTATLEMNEGTSSRFWGKCRTANCSNIWRSMEEQKTLQRIRRNNEKIIFRIGNPVLADPTGTVASP